MTPEKIKRLRLRLKRSQEEMASLIGVHLVTWNRWENGKAVPRKRDQEALANLYKRFVLPTTHEQDVRQEVAK